MVVSVGKSAGPVAVEAPAGRAATRRRRRSLLADAVSVVGRRRASGERSGDRERGTTAWTTRTPTPGTRRLDRLGRDRCRRLPLHGFGVVARGRGPARGTGVAGAPTVSPPGGGTAPTRRGRRYRTLHAAAALLVLGCCCCRRGSRTSAPPASPGSRSSRSPARARPSPCPAAGRGSSSAWCRRGRLLAVGRVADMGFDEVRRRPFDPVLDWAFVGDAAEFLRTRWAARGRWVPPSSRRRPLGLVALTTLAASARRPGGAAPPPGETRPGRGLGAVVLAACAHRDRRRPAVGGPQASVTPCSAPKRSTRGCVNGRRRGTGRDDAFSGAPAADLLNGAAGQDGDLVFVESYGRSAVQECLTPLIDPALTAGAARLNAAGFSARSGWLTSPTFGGPAGSPIPRSVGPVGRQPAARPHLVASDRFTLTGAFARAGWRTVGLEPGVNQAWPRAPSTTTTRSVDSRGMGYRGPQFGWAAMPDQFMLDSLGRAELTKATHRCWPVDPVWSQPRPLGATPRTGRRGAGRRRLRLRRHARARPVAEVLADPVRRRRRTRVDRLQPRHADLVRAALRRRRYRWPCSWATTSRRRS